MPLIGQFIIHRDVVVPGQPWYLQTIELDKVPGRPRPEARPIYEWSTGDTRIDLGPRGSRRRHNHPRIRHRLEARVRDRHSHNAADRRFTQHR